MLELYFIDVGQGDSILIHTQFNEKLLIDGGPDNTMHRFLQSKYNAESQVNFDAIVMTHADKDHSAGLVPVLEDKKISTKAFLHNGIAKFKEEITSKSIEETTSTERSERDTSTGRIQIEGKSKKLLQIFDQTEELDSSNRELGEEFAKLIKAIKTSRERNSDLNIKRLDNSNGEIRLKNTGSSDSQEKFSISVLGPVNIGSKRPAYHYEVGDGETINGNSISLLIKYGNCRILLCGDMNKEFEQKFMEFYKDEKEYQAHIFKANHHGSQYFCNEFLKKVSPSISVVSAGYHHKYGHPRAILLGGLGKYSFNNTDKPLLFITKISGTYRKISIEYIVTRSKSLMNELKEIAKEKLNNFFKFFNSTERESKEFFSDLLSNVYEKSIDGTIYVRTDGTTIVAGRIIAITRSIKTEWELYTFTIEGNRLVKHTEDYDCKINEMMNS